jgi:hypothetical protein
MVTLEEAKTLKSGTILYSTEDKNSDGTPARWKVNGKVKTWKRSPERVKVPLKRGLYEYGYLDEDILQFFTLREEEAANGL